jgi:predicted ATPase
MLAFWHDIDEPDVVLPLAGEVVWFCRDRGLDYWRFVAESVHGWARVYAGDADAGVEQIQSAHAHYRATGAQTPYAYRVAYEVDALLQAGRVDEGLALVDDTLARYATNLDRFADAELNRLRGALLEQADDRTRAAEAYAAARQLANLQRTRWLALRAAMSAACCDVSAAYVAEARVWLQAEYEQFTEGHETRRLRDARAILSAAN